MSTWQRDRRRGVSGDRFVTLAWALLLGAACAAPPSPELDAGLDAGSADVASPDHGVVGYDAATADLSHGLDPVGAASTLELMTWNLQSFPLNGDQTVEAVAGAIVDLDVDLVAVQEIMDMRDFQRLTGLLGGYQGVLNSDNLLRTGFIYRSSVLTLTSQTELFTDNTYAFIRSPLRADFEAVDPEGGGRYELTAIVVHLKAGTLDDEQNQRRAACQALKEYLDSERASNPGRDYLVLGDFNDQLDDSSGNNVFTVFLDDPGAYRFLTSPLADRGEWSHPGYQILIDHLLVADNGAADFSGDQTQVLHLDAEIPGYVNTVSDHRPVVTAIEPLVWR